MARSILGLGVFYGQEYSKLGRYSRARSILGPGVF